MITWIVATDTILLWGVFRAFEGSSCCLLRGEWMGNPVGYLSAKETSARMFWSVSVAS